jgi:hypothetical protein
LKYWQLGLKYGNVWTYNDRKCIEIKDQTLWGYNIWPLNLM